MKLYHFTSEMHFEHIKKTGLSRGDVPLSPMGGINYPWLTRDPERKKQSWSFGSVVDKQEVRITVEIPMPDENLITWSTLAEKEGVDRGWYAALNEAGGGGAEDWYVYRGVIPPEWFVEIDHKSEVKLDS